MPEFSERGFAQFPPFTCSYGSEVRLYESSNASGPHIWLNIDDSRWRTPKQKAEDNVNHSSAHLTLDQARELSNRLQTAIAFMEQRDRDWIGEEEDDDA